MRAIVRRALLGAAVMTGAAALAAASAPPPPAAMPSFASDEALRAFLAKHAPRQIRAFASDAAMPPPPPPPPPAAMAYAPSAANVTEMVVTAEKRETSITNNQVAGVDEGDIVKLSGDVLVILHRGRLFTVSLAGGRMRPADRIDAYPPGVDPSGDWYDEMLVDHDWVVVIGYSYSRGGTQIDRFRLAPDGHLAFADAYQLRSNDYYSSRNYASRLIGDRLILYSPLSLDWGDPLAGMPSMRRWSGVGEPGPFRRIIGPRHVYVPRILQDSPDADVDTLHTVTSCDLTAPQLECGAIGVLGPSSRSYYVSDTAVYVWVSGLWGYGPWRDRGFTPSLLYRLPLDGGPPSAVGVYGAPPDQFAFQEDAGRRELDVLVRSEGGGDSMWRPEFSEGALALARIGLADFGDGSRSLAGARYQRLPRPSGAGYDFHDRFVGDWLLYGDGADWDGERRAGGQVVALPVRGGPPTTLRLAHGVDRLEALGGDGLVVGADGRNLAFTSIELSAGRPRVGDSYILPDASQGETRSHGFFFRSDEATPDGASGVLALAVARAARPAYQELFENSAAMLFLRREDRRLGPLGELDASQSGFADNACRASCIDWYGNARPIFAGRRTFALLGYELVEGRIEDGEIDEIGRINFAPGGRALER